MLIQKVLPVSRGPFQTQSPFLFAVYHLDNYPPSRAQDGMGVQPALLHGRNLGMDFGNSDWNMYHGRLVPGFPQHPHCGFSTITLVRRGTVDHHDSLGSYGRFADGDTQWMDAGRGVSHSEMLPLLHAEEGKNTLDLFQIWLNLPRASKGCAPNYTMQWREQAVKARIKDSHGRIVQVETVAGQLEGWPAPQKPPQDNYARDPENCVAIWVISMDAGARWEIPAAPTGVNRSVIFFKGDEINVGEYAVKRHANMHVDASLPCPLHNTGTTPAELLMLQGRPIDEPVVQQGPFVTSSRPEMQQAIQAYHRGHFGKWPFEQDDPVLPRESPRFAHYGDGREERPE
ncbi:putative quercetin 2,3-dioxygenase [Porphyridium purpureum]|uniref:Putative quercetin 2,3-dioxygenase n=1 Tax=Porphyridium purpureum TaxID=35688 RepID=A0A5J4YKW4_PORPP|nr:putative quercetin 2,3-dioxygenase [Porphyridium purpureum]|eukprot:POR9047..scf249_10